MYQSSDFFMSVSKSEIKKTNSVPLYDSPVKIMAIAGSDCSGGAGIQADIKTATSCHVYASTVITAVTVQNSSSVSDIVPLSPSLIEQQFKAIIADEFPDAVKIGMIPEEEAASCIAECISLLPSHIPVILDPVLVATSGKPLSSARFLTRYLFPLASVITPNLPEASAVSGRMIEEASPEEALTFLEEFDCRGVIIKGGHGTKNVITDALAYTDEEGAKFTSVFSSGRIDCNNLHGTGCTFSTLLACYLAEGFNMQEAFQSACGRMKHIISHSVNYSYGGASNGPLNVADYKIKTYENFGK